MGCDIHLAVEARDGDEWKRVEAMVDGFAYDTEVEDEVEALVRESWYRSRNYPLFSVLGNLSRGYGPLVYPLDEADAHGERGLPVDVSAEWQEEVDSWGFDAHTPGWATLEELFAYDWSQRYGPEDAYGWEGRSIEEAIFMFVREEFLMLLLRMKVHALERSLDFKDVRIVYFFDN